MHIDNKFVSRSLSDQDFGITSVTACRIDSRFSYCLFVPPELATGEKKSANLIVSVHGTGRMMLAHRDAYIDLARLTGTVVLAPLFPANILGNGDFDGYKFLQEGCIRYDLILLSMIEEIESRYGFSFDTFGLAGFSGGAQFAHRFYLLHAARLWGVFIGAPGYVTLLDSKRCWWVGTQDIATKFGITVDLRALQKVAVYMLVGANDLNVSEITLTPENCRWVEGANDAGRTRPDRLASLNKSFENSGIQTHLEIVPGMAHEEIRALDYACAFFSGILAHR